MVLLFFREISRPSPVCCCAERLGCVSSLSPAHGVACPRCQAPASKLCVTKQGIDKSDVHAVRARLTLRVMAA